uniref:14-3-3 domain-containing protein n=1 Tax=Kalanchoe fedtschenkoi TaxID=63787 RepID=A0A7N0UIP5_KALFE
MVEFMEKVISAILINEELTMEERNLLSLKYKNVIKTHRVSCSIISSVKQKEESHKKKGYVATIHEYWKKIKSELSLICEGILKLLSLKLVESVSVGDSDVIYLKMEEIIIICIWLSLRLKGEKMEGNENFFNAHKAGQVCI